MLNKEHEKFERLHMVVYVAKAPKSGTWLTFTYISSSLAISYKNYLKRKS